MLSVGFVLETLGDNILKLQVKTGDVVSIGGIAFADSRESYSADTLILCPGELLPGLLARQAAADGATVIVAGGSAGTPLPDGLNLNVAVTSLELLELYRLLSGPLEASARQESRLLEALLVRGDLESVLQYASGLLGADVLYLGPDGRPLGSCMAEKPGDPLVAAVLEAERPDILWPQTEERPYSAIQGCRVFLRRVCNKTGRFYYLYNLIEGDEIVCSLLLAAGAGSRKTDVHSWAALTVRCIRRLDQRGGAANKAKGRAFYGLVSSIMEEKISLPEIKRGLAMAPHPVRNFCAIGIAEFEGRVVGENSCDHLMRGLAEIFPGCNMVVYGGAVMVLISFDERNLHLSFDRPRLSELLESHDACMGISNASRNRAMLRTLAMQCRSTLRLARVLRASTENRIFLHEDYSIYNIIDLCARSFKEEYHHDDLLYLIHPCIVQLARYDLKNSSNLVEVLYHYLVSGCNLVKTARALYMHRNTVLNKVNKAIDIIGRSLEDGEFQQRLMFSTQLLRYFERYLGKDVILN